MPELRVLLSQFPPVIWMRVGMRWTTLTQLPLAFSDGSGENEESLAAATASTLPVHEQCG